MGQSRFSVPSSDERFCERLFKFTLTLTFFFSWLNIDNQDKKKQQQKGNVRENAWNRNPVK